MPSDMKHSRFTSILVSRFLLDLQEAHRKSVDADFQFADSSRLVETLVFQQPIGSPIVLLSATSTEQRNEVDEQVEARHSADTARTVEWMPMKGRSAEVC